MRSNLGMVSLRLHKHVSTTESVSITSIVYIYGQLWRMCLLKKKEKKVLCTLYYIYRFHYHSGFFLWIVKAWLLRSCITQAEPITTADYKVARLFHNTNTLTLLLLNLLHFGFFMFSGTCFFHVHLWWASSSLAFLLSFCKPLHSTTIYIIVFVLVNILWQPIFT